MLKNLARHLAPGIAADRARRHEADFRERTGITRLAERLDPVVQAGPFAGMRYPPGRLGDVDAAGAKLLGIYERELQSVFEQAIQQRAQFTDIGCADGFFAVGMAMRGCPSVAYDISKSARRLCGELAALNGAQVEIRSTFDEPPAGGLLLCDIEGAERQLFTSGLAAALADVSVVVEVHEDQQPGTAAHLRELFSATHEDERIDHRPLQPEEVPVLADWDDEDVRKVV